MNVFFVNAGPNIARVEPIKVAGIEDLMENNKFKKRLKKKKFEKEREIVSLMHISKTQFKIFVQVSVC